MPIKRSRIKSRKRRGGMNKNGTPLPEANAPPEVPPPEANAPPEVPPPEEPPPEEPPPEEPPPEESPPEEPPPEEPPPEEPSPEANAPPEASLAEEPLLPVAQNISLNTKIASNITGESLKLVTAADNMARNLKQQDKGLVNKAVVNITDPKNGGSYSKKHRKHKSKSRRRSTRMNKSKKYKKSRRQRR